MPPSPLLALTSMTAASPGACAPCELSSATTALAVDAATAGSSAVALAPDTVTPVRWSGVIGVEGELTGDGRFIEHNALIWDALPLPLRYVRQDVGEHGGAVVVGQIDTLARGASGLMEASGFFDTTPDAIEAMGAVDSKMQDGVSMDLDDVSFEVRVKAELLDPANDPLMAMLMGESSNDMPAPDAEGRVTVATINSDDEVMATLSARIRAATLVSIPAFNTARIALVTDAAAADPPTPPAPAGSAPALPGSMPDGSDCSCTEGAPGYDPDCGCEPASEQDMAPPAHADGMMPDGTTPCSTDENDPAYDPDCAARTPGQAPAGAPAPQHAAAALAASAAPDAPPTAWFSRPRLREATALTVTPQGQVYGHLAAWNTCHISHTHAGCVTPPHSAAGYAYFHTGACLTAEGSEVPVGHVTLDTRHAGEHLTAASAAAHYEHTGSVVADVAAGEDEFGIWVAGALRPSATETQVRALRSAPLSGDWRRIAGSLELVAALAVNVPGFPVPRPRGLVAAGVTQSIVASGMIPPRTVRRPGTPGALSLDDLRYLKRLADRERAEESRAALEPLPAAVALARRVRASSLSMRAHRRPPATSKEKENS